jgi:hypothetical protein
MVFCCRFVVSCAPKRFGGGACEAPKDLFIRSTA